MIVAPNRSAPGSCSRRVRRQEDPLAGPFQVLFSRDLENRREPHADQVLVDGLGIRSGSCWNPAARRREYVSAMD